MHKMTKHSLYVDIDTLVSALIKAGVDAPGLAVRLTELEDYAGPPKDADYSTAVLDTVEVDKEPHLCITWWVREPPLEK